MKFKRFLNEEMPQLKPFHKIEFEKLGRIIKYKDRYKNLFGDEDRVYLSVPDDEVEIHKGSYDVDVFDVAYTFAQKLFRKYGRRFEFVNDFENEKIEFKIYGEIPKELKEKLKKEQLRFKYIDLIKKYGNETQKEQLEKIPKFKTYNNLKVVISRNPCDIGSMSTGTAWTSCMNLYTGAYNKYTREDVIYGTLVAYLIDSKDVNIDKPLGRKLIKPYVSKDGRIYLVLTRPVYGIFTDKAEKVIQKWLDSHQKDIEGYFKMHPRLYPDDSVTHVEIKKK